MRSIAFHADAYEEFTEWARIDKKIFERIDNLIRESLRTPFSGTGRPEPLKYKFKGCWSRRITDEHRLIYTVSDDFITIVSCRSHYK
ncbi:MAG: Txe/YoeB family addiction module toxin [Ignavibacteriae bacterium]|nr:Txe/YoeB family addiction module toxin [Ignavibacteriota bacterium]